MPRARCAIEKFIASKSGTPIVENQTRLIFLAKDKDGARRASSATSTLGSDAAGYDVAIGKTTRSTDVVVVISRARRTRTRVSNTVSSSTRSTRPIHESEDGAGVCRTALRSPHAVLRRTAGSRRSRIGAEGRGDCRNVRVAVARRQARVWFYLPPGYAAAKDSAVSRHYVLDGANYVEKMDVPRVLDHLIANKSIPPVIAVFSEPADRQESIRANPKWRAFIATSWCRRWTSASARSRRRIIASILGSSLAAYGAVDLAVARPSVFGTVRGDRAAGADRDGGLESAERARGGGVDQVFRDGRRLRLDDRRRPLASTTLDDILRAGHLSRSVEGHNTNTFRGHLDDAPEGANPSVGNRPTTRPLLPSHC
jgi:hypothetical protein